MKAKKLIRYRIPVSVTFPATHPRKGELTYFIDKILKQYSDFYTFLGWQKIHTIRGGKSKSGKSSYEFWAKRFEKINKGEAVLELYCWEGKPYKSKTITICQLSKDDGVGIQRLDFLNGNFSDPVAFDSEINVHLTREQLAKNDGLSLEDFTAWFKGYEVSEPLAIIHFTPFRY